MFCPACAARSNRTTSPSRCVCSIITTASAPGGIAAPVMICTQVPAASGSLTASPALISPTHFSLAPGATSFARTAYPSRVDRSNGGYSRSVFTSSASTNPSASHTLTTVVAHGPFLFPSCSIIFPRASSKVSISSRVWHPIPRRHKSLSRVTSSQPPRQQRPRRHNRRVAFRPRGNHADFHLQKIRNKSQILHRRLGQLRSIFQAIRRFIPARQRLVLRRYPLVLFRQRRHFLQRRSLVLVAHANLNLPLRVKHIQLRNHQRINPIDHFRVPQHLQIQPAAAPWPPRNRAKLFPARAHFLRIQVRHLRRKRSAAHARRVRLGNTQHVFELRRRHAHACRSTPRSRARRCHERVRPVIDVQHRSLRAFEQHRLPFVQRAVHQFRGVADVSANFFAQLQRLFDFMRKVNIRSVRAFRQPIFLRHHMRGLLAKHLRLQQIAHPQAAPRHLVLIRRSDSPRSRANLVRAPRTFRGFVQLPVIRKNQVRAVADVQPPLHLNARFRKRLDFRHQRRRIHHHARSDHRLLLRPQNPARNQLQYITVLPDDDRVPRVVPARHARNVIKRPRKVVHHLAFALVAPLRPHHHHRFHSDSLLNHTSAPQSLLCLYYFGKHQETAGSNRKLAPPPTQASLPFSAIGTTPYTENSSPDDRSPSRSPASARNKSSTPQTGIPASANPCSTRPIPPSSPASVRASSTHSASAAHPQISRCTHRRSRTLPAPPKTPAHSRSPPQFSTGSG